MRSLAFFNNKGGVGKTTLLCNLAGYLALELNRKVLVVDADPQCNATQNLCSDEVITDLYENERFTVYSIVHPLSIGRGYQRALDWLPVESFGCDLIPGDPRLALTEDLLAGDWVAASSGSTRGLRTSFLFAELLERCEEYDYVLFDMGPSLGSINRAVLLASRFFITPMSIDIFSLRAIDNMAQSFRKWQTQLDAGLTFNEEPAELEVDNPGWDLRFAGYVTQQYTAKRDAEGQARPVKAFDHIMQQIPGAIEDAFVENGQGSIAYDLGSVPTLHSLIPMSQTSRKPIFALKAGDGVVGAHFARIKDYELIIRGIAQKLEHNLSCLDD